jgi:hypothetical protein
MDNEPPAMNPKEKKELALAEVTVIILGAVGLAAIIWLTWLRPQATPKAVPKITTYEACMRAGDAIKQTSPEVCTTKDDKRFVKPGSN